MKTFDIDQPVKLGLGFWITYAVLALPTLWISKPLLRDLPMYAIIAKVLLLPFLAAIFVYSLFLFTKAVVCGGSKQRTKFLAFLAAVACAAAFVGVSYLFYGSKHNYFYLGFVAGFLALIVYRVLQPKAPVQPPDTAIPADAPPASQKLRQD